MANTSRVVLPRVIGHRGAAARAPENTLVGLRCAKRLGLSWVEVDVRLAAGGLPVLHHDPHFGRTSNGAGLVAEADEATLAALDAGVWFGPSFAGERVPTLAQALALLDELDLGLVLEHKATQETADAVVAASAAVLRRGGWLAPAALARGRLLLSSLEPAAVAALARALPEAPRALAQDEPGCDVERTLVALGCCSLHLWHERLDPALPARVRANLPEVSLAAYTVNDPARAAELSALGIEAVFSDVPDVLLAAPRSPPSAAASARRASSPRPPAG